MPCMGIVLKYEVAYFKNNHYYVCVLKIHFFKDVFSCFFYLSFWILLLYLTLKIALMYEYTQTHRDN